MRPPRRGPYPPIMKDLMKQLLIASTSLVALSAAPILAAEWDIRVNGYYFLGLAASDSPG